MFEAGDLATDIITWHRAVIVDTLGADQLTKMLYSIFVVVAVIASVTTLFYRVRVAQKLKRAAVERARNESASSESVTRCFSASESWLQKLRWEVDRSHRELTM